MPTTTTPPPFAVLDKPQTGYASINVAIGPLLSVEMSAVSMTRPNVDAGTATKMICPTCANGDVKQKYHCPGGHGPFEKGDMHRAVPYVADPATPKDVTLVPVADEELELAKFGALKDPDPKVKPRIEFRLHPADQVLTVTRPGSLQYRMRPRTGAPQAEKDLYAAITQTVATHQNPGKGTDPVVWIGTVRIRDSYAMYRLEVWHGQLCLTELVHPSDLAPVDAQYANMEPPAALVEQLAPFLTVVDFDHEEYRSRAPERVAEMAKAKLKAGDTKLPAPPVEMDAAALIAAALDAGKVTTARKPRPRKAPAKKAPAKKAAAPRRKVTT